MTIQEFAESEGYPTYFEMGIMYGKPVYRLTFPGWEEACTGFPIFAIPEDSDFKILTEESEIFEVMDYFIAQQEN